MSKKPRYDDTQVQNLRMNEEIMWQIYRQNRMVASNRLYKTVGRFNMLKIVLTMLATKKQHFSLRI